MTRRRGRTVGIAFVFLCLIGFAAAAVQTMSPTIVVRDPRRNRSFEQSLPIQFRKIAVRITGCLAETSITMSFQSDYRDNLEGSFHFPLPPGSTVSGYALDVQGQMVEGVVVDKERARYIFETEVRRSIDPGLVEWSGGNVFRTRVYPIPPGGSRTIVIRYVSLLGSSPDGQEGSLYVLPLRSAFPQAELELHIEVSAAGKPAAHWPPGHVLEFSGSGGRYVASTRLRDFRLQEDLRVRLAGPSGRRVWAERSSRDGQVYFVAQEPPSGAAAGAAAGTVEALYVLWDASGSAAGSTRDRSLPLLLEIVARFQPRELYLIPFRDRPDVALHFPAGPERAAALEAALRQLPYDGATDLGAALEELAALAETLGGRGGAGQDALGRAVSCVFTDTEPATLPASAEPPAPPGPVYVFVDGAPERVPLAGRLAGRSGGAAFDLTAAATAEILEEMARPKDWLEGVEASGGAVADLLWRGDPAPGAPVTVCGRLLSDQATLSLRFASGRTSRVTIDARGLEDGRGAGGAESGQPRSLLDTFWAQTLVSHLAAFPEANREALTSVGKGYGVVTPFSSLLVLETLDQHLRYRVEPPRSLTQMYQEYLRRRQEPPRPDWELRAAQQAREKLASIYELYERWWRSGNPPQKSRHLYGPANTYAPKRFYGGGCFPAGTTILTPAGPRAIETIRPGEQVYAWNAAAGRWETRPVGAALVRAYRGDVVTLEAGSASLSATGNHPFWVVRGEGLASRPPAADVPPAERRPGAGGRWVEARHLRAGDVLASKVEGEVAVRRVETRRGELAVYNLTVAARHSYAVSLAGIAVHNKGEKEAAAGPASEAPGSEAQPGLAIQARPWDPAAPYLGEAEGLDVEAAYATYLRQKERWMLAPSFFLVWAERFFSAGQGALGVRVISNAFELGYLDPVFLRSVLFLLESHGQLEESLRVAQTLAELAPEGFQLPHPPLYRLALLEAGLGRYQRSLELLARLVEEVRFAPDEWELRDQDGEASFGGLRLAALAEYGRIREKARRLGVEVSDPLPKELRGENLEVDLRVVLEWSTPESGGLLVVEPSGEEVYYHNLRSESGGLVTPAWGFSTGPDVYQIRTAQAGAYQIKYICGDASFRYAYGPTVVKATIYTNFGRPGEEVRVVALPVRQTGGVVEVATVHWR